MSLNSFRTGLGNVTSNPAGKWILFAVSALLVSSLVLSGVGTGTNLGSLSGAQTAQTGTDVIATVNGDPLTRADFEGSRQDVQSRLDQSGQTIPAAQQPVFNNAVLDHLIDTHLQLQEAKKENIPVSADEIAKKRAQILDQSNYRQSLGLPATASIADIDAALAKAQSPSIEDRLPDDTLRQFILIGDQNGQPGKLQTSILNSVVVSDDEAKQFYTKYHTRHILIGNKTRSDAQAKAQAAEIIAKAKAPGADFAALAKLYSDDPGSKDKGGDDGFIDQSTQYVPEFKQAAFSLKSGEVTPDPVASPQYGYFIIKLDAVQSSLPADFAKNKAKYTEAIRQQKAQDKYQALMTSLKAAAKIDVKDPALAGDRALAEAGQAGNPALSQPKLQAALADYHSALKANPPALEKATLNASVGQIYQALRQFPQAIAADEAALALHPDPALEMTTGQLCLQAKQPAQAVAHFQKASQLAWNDQSTHIQLLQMFQQAGRTDLAAKEGDWLKQYAKAHPAAAGGGLPGMPGQPGTMPLGAVPQSAGSIHIGTPPARKPVQ